MATKRGLGMGLNALFSETESAYEKAQSDAEAREEQSPAGTAEIDLKKISPNPDQPRKTFTRESMEELANSIKMHGVIQPIVVNKTAGGKFMIIAGERRYRAALIAGLATIPAVVKEYDDRTVKEISIIENLQREDLNPVEAARAIRRLMDEFSFTQEEVAERLGKSRPAIANTLRLLKLGPTVLDMVESGKISEGHARTLVVVDDIVLQTELAKVAVERQMNVRDFEDFVRTTLKPKKEKTEKPQAEQSTELKDLVSRMQRVLATRVQIIGNDRKGRIYIDYFSRDDLERINELLNAKDE